MKKTVEAGKTYIGVVEDIKDPEKKGRIKVRVMDIFDDQKVEDIPWAAPWKDLSGGQFSLPENGKVVIVVFEKGDTYKPEYIFTEHWNINLENKLKGLGDSDYESMKSVIFDHKTQIYSNDSEGLKIDHKFNNINIKENGINVNLKDNNAMLNLGDSTADQQMILGNHWMDWFDEFVGVFMENTAFLGNLGAPVLASPRLINIMLKYKSKRDPVFLSHHVNIVDNDKVSTVKNDKREETAQLGDGWKSTIRENKTTTVTQETSQPTDGVKPKYDDKFVGPDTSVPVPVQTVTNPLPPPTKEEVPPIPVKSSIQSNPKVEKIIWFLKSKNYEIYETPNVLNMVAFRNKESNITNKFDDRLCVFFRNDNNNWELMEYSITTVPGFLPGKKYLPVPVSILRLGQYVKQLSMTIFAGDENHKCLVFEKCALHKNTSKDSYNYESPTEIGEFPLTIHRSNKTGTSEYVFNYSKGSQAFKNINQYNQFIKICEKQVTSGDKKFTYTLCSKKEFDSYADPDEQREKLEKFGQTASVVVSPPVVVVPPVQSGTASSQGSLTIEESVKNIEKLVKDGFELENTGVVTFRQVSERSKKEGRILNTREIFTYASLDVGSDVDIIKTKKEAMAKTYEKFIKKYGKSPNLLKDGYIMVWNAYSVKQYIGDPKASSSSEESQDKARKKLLNKFGIKVPENLAIRGIIEAKIIPFGKKIQFTTAKK
jgi:hypothetical protein